MQTSTRAAFAATMMLASGLASTPAGAEELTGTLRKVKETGVITLGFRDASVPFSFLDGNQKPVGYALDICYRIADAVKERLGLSKLDIRLNGVTSATRIPLIANGTIDLECGSTTNNFERRNQVAFTNTDFLTATRFVAKRSAGLHTIDDLRGKTVVSTSGTINLRQITSYMRKCQAVLVRRTLTSSMTAGGINVNTPKRLPLFKDELSAITNTGYVHPWMAALTVLKTRC